MVLDLRDAIWAGRSSPGQPPTATTVVSALGLGCGSPNAEAIVWRGYSWAVGSSRATCPGPANLARHGVHGRAVDPVGSEPSRERHVECSVQSLAATPTDVRQRRWASAHQWGLTTSKSPTSRASRRQPLRSRIRSGLAANPHTSLAIGDDGVFRRCRRRPSDRTLRSSDVEPITSLDDAGWTDGACHASRRAGTTGPEGAGLARCA